MENDKNEVNEKEEWFEKVLNSQDFKLSRNCKYYYNLQIIHEQIEKLKDSSCFDRIYYALKANFNRDILRYFIRNNLGIETVSLEEVELVLSVYDEEKLNTKNILNILYTPNFADISDFEAIFSKKIENVEITVILDNLDIIKETDLFNNKKIGIRLDLNLGAGHCKKVITQGNLSKFGILPCELMFYKKLLSEKLISIIGFHSHMGSGIHDYEKWSANFQELLNIKKELEFPIEFLNIGGGFGVEKDIDFLSLNKSKTILKEEFKFNGNIYTEPGRFLVADCGVIIGKVNQIKTKNGIKIIGLNINMTDIIRFCLYDAKHEILFYRKEKSGYKKLVSNESYAKIVGTICESGDVFYESLKVNEDIKTDDVAIMLKTGAYGRVMCSNYNCKVFPEEIIIEK